MHQNFARFFIMGVIVENEYRMKKDLFVLILSSVHPSFSCLSIKVLKGSHDERPIFVTQQNISLIIFLRPGIVSGVFSVI